MGTATLRRSVYTKFGGYYPKGAKVEVDTIDIANDRILIKKPKYEGPGRISLKAKDLIMDIRWKQIA